MRIQMGWAALAGLALALANGTQVAAAQAAAAVAVPPSVQPSAGVDYRSQQALEHLGKELMRASESSSSGSVAVTLDKYPTHFTMLSTRTRSGGAELHKRFADIFVVLDGEATEVTGGTIIDPSGTGDEVRGARVEGGSSQLLRKGDVLTIAPNTPHQTVLAPGKTFTYFVVKVAVPKQD
jgi:mannose-6-phosphate isomerase-like protein (cupin superfamily)